LSLLIICAHIPIVMPGDRHSSADPNGSFPFEEPNLSGNCSARCQRHFVVCMIISLVIHPAHLLGRSYNPTASMSHIPGNESGTISIIPGGSITGQYAGETCTIQSPTNSLSFTYNASSMSRYLFPTIPNQYTFCVQSCRPTQPSRTTCTPPAHALYWDMEPTLRPVRLQVPT